EHLRYRFQRVDGRVESLCSTLARQHDRGGKMPEDMRRSWVGEVIRWNVDRLNRGHCARRGGANPLLEFCDLGGEGRLVADPRRDLTQEARDLRSRLDEAIDVVD